MSAFGTLRKMSNHTQLVDCRLSFRNGSEWRIWGGKRKVRISGLTTDLCTPPYPCKSQSLRTIPPRNSFDTLRNRYVGVKLDELRTSWLHRRHRSRPILFAYRNEDRDI